MSRPPLQWRVGDRCCEPKGRIGRITKLEYGVAFIELEDGGELSEEADNLDLVPLPPEAKS